MAEGTASDFYFKISTVSIIVTWNLKLCVCVRACGGSFLRNDLVTKRWGVSSERLFGGFLTFPPFVFTRSHNYFPSLGAMASAAQAYVCGPRFRRVS